MKDELRKIAAFIRIYTGKEPYEMSEERFALVWNELKWAINNGHPKYTFTNVK